MGYRDNNDGRYYVPVIIYSAYYKRNARFNFLIDTGATFTYEGVGGGVMGYLLQGCTLVFNSNIGRYDIPLGDLSVSDFLTIDGKPCPPLPSVLGIDVLDKFDLLFETNRLYLRKKIR
jgi:hypothetical protein